jgi:hypothetical protein
LRARELEDGRVAGVCHGVRIPDERRTAVHALLRHRLQVPEERIEPSENGGLLDDRRQRRTALQGTVDLIEAPE